MRRCRGGLDIWKILSGRTARDNNCPATPEARGGSDRVVLDAPQSQFRMRRRAAERVLVKIGVALDAHVERAVRHRFGDAEQHIARLRLTLVDRGAAG